MIEEGNLKNFTTPGSIQYSEIYNAEKNWNHNVDNRHCDSRIDFRVMIIFAIVVKIGIIEMMCSLLLVEIWGFSIMIRCRWIHRGSLSLNITIRRKILEIETRRILTDIIRRVWINIRKTGI